MATIAEDESANAPQSSRTLTNGTGRNSSNPTQDLIKCWCRKCNVPLFQIRNTWRAVSGEYVEHPDKAAVSEIEAGLRKGNDELNGKGELEGCKLLYLHCQTCSTRVGLYCVKGTRMKRYKECPFLRTTKLLLKQTPKGPAVDFNISPMITKADGSPENIPISDATATYNVLPNTQAVPDDESPASPAQSIPVRERTSERLSNIDNTVPKFVGTKDPDAGKYSPGTCQTCYFRRVKCEGGRPSCGTCINSGNKCIWREGLINNISQSSILPPEQKFPACGQCRMRHAVCDDQLPICSACLQNGRICRRKGVVQAAVQRPVTPSDADSDQGMPGLIIGSPRASRHDSRSTRLLTRMLQEQQETIHKHKTMIDNIIGRIETIHREATQQGAEMQTKISQLDERISKMSQLEHSVHDSSTTIQANGMGSHRLSAPARRGGLSFQGSSTSARKSFPEPTAGKRSFDGVSKAPTVSRVYPDTNSHEQSAVVRHEQSTPDPQASSSYVIDHTLYDATPPPERQALRMGISADSMDLDKGQAQASERANSTLEAYRSSLPSSITVPGSMLQSNDASKPVSSNTLRNFPASGNQDFPVPQSQALSTRLFMTQRPPTLAQVPDSQPAASIRPDSALKPTRQNTTDIEDDGTQEYLKRTVHTEDPDDDDFVYQDDEDEARFIHYEPNASGVRSSVERLLTPAHPLERSPKSKRGSSGGRRGRPPLQSKLRELSLTHSGTPNPNGNSIDDQLTAPGAHRSGPMRRGVSGGLKPVPTELSHRAHAMAHVSTPYVDRDTKRQKLDNPPVSYRASFSPQLGSDREGPSSRYPHGRMRDAEGFLLRADGTRDLRSVRGRALGNAVFRKSENGERWTVEKVMAAKAAGSLSTSLPETPVMVTKQVKTNDSSSPAPQPTIGTGGLDGHTVALASQGFTAINTGNDGLVAAKEKEERPNIGTLAAQAERERVAKAHDKAVAGNKQYSAAHRQIMAKMFAS